MSRRLRQAQGGRRDNQGFYTRAAERSSKRAPSVASLSDIVFSVGGHLGFQNSNCAPHSSLRQSSSENGHTVMVPSKKYDVIVIGGGPARSRRRKCNRSGGC